MVHERRNKGNERQIFQSHTFVCPSRRKNDEEDYNQQQAFGQIVSLPWHEGRMAQSKCARTAPRGVDCGVVEQHYASGGLRHSEQGSRRSNRFAGVVCNFTRVRHSKDGAAPVSWAVVAQIACGHKEDFCASRSR